MMGWFFRLSLSTRILVIAGLIGVVLYGIRLYGNRQYESGVADGVEKQLKADAAKLETERKQLLDDVTRQKAEIETEAQALDAARREVNQLRADVRRTLDARITEIRNAEDKSKSRVDTLPSDQLGPAIRQQLDRLDTIEQQRRANPTPGTGRPPGLVAPGGTRAGVGGNRRHR